MVYLVLFLTLAVARPVAASALRGRVELRACQDALAVADEVALRRWLTARAAAALGEVDYVMLSNYRRLNPEYAGRRAFAVDEVLELLGEQRANRMVDHVVRRRSWQFRLFGDVWATPPGLALTLHGDRLRWSHARRAPSRGEFVILLHWESPVPAALVDRLPDLVWLAHKAGPAAHAPLRLVRAGDPLDGELYVVVDVAGRPDARYALTLGLLKALQDDLMGLAALARRP